MTIDVLAIVDKIGVGVSIGMIIGVIVATEVGTSITDTIIDDTSVFETEVRGRTAVTVTDAWMVERDVGIREGNGGVDGVDTIIIGNIREKN